MNKKLVLLCLNIVMSMIHFSLTAMAQGSNNSGIKEMSAINQQTQSKDINIAKLTEARLPNAIITNSGTLFVTANTVSIDGVGVNGIISRSTNCGKDWQISSLDFKMPKGFLYDKENDAIFFLNSIILSDNFISYPPFDTSIV